MLDETDSLHGENDQTERRSIMLVTHCWRYSKVLRYQLSSLVLEPPQGCQVTARIFYCEEDRPTAELLGMYETDNSVLKIVADALDKPALLHRAIGRNIAALETQADIVWFTDADYCFGPGCLDALAALELPEDKHLFYPRRVQISINHDIGNEYTLGDPELAVVDIDPADFHTEVLRKAIGGVQIVRGDTARELGYCPDTDYQRPVQGDKFKRNWADIEYRRILHRHYGDNFTARIDLPNLYRIRQKFGVVDSLVAGDS